ncbi:MULTISPECIES: hypothetical protein [unclassified Streptomyces]|uniref:hypothetical protein n=1 Tax=unclassified Streptomyces TaxID=2593676 RepID=UPI000AA6953D|nr:MULTISPECIES: hypothetical protein [unclassified Streptomyces]
MELYAWLLVNPLVDCGGHDFDPGPPWSLGVGLGPLPLTAVHTGWSAGWPY